MGHPKPKIVMVKIYMDHVITMGVMVNKKTKKHGHDIPLDLIHIIVKEI